jgi:Tfp pilus assembly protein PilX
MTLKYNTKNKKGIALILSSIILICMLFLTLASMNSSLVTRKVISAEQSVQQARIAAEAAVREGEKEITNSNLTQSDFSDSCTNGKCTQSTSKGIWNSTSKWSNAKTAASDLKTKSNLQESPKYLIEFLGEKKISDSLSVGSGYDENEDYTSTPVYRVTGKAKGKQGNNESVIQSTIH